ncbi:7-cyano-7-deazaguanine synthase [Tundrisphaera lichenicola]|uniref:7-cyano-7-deazaguanine synthase n=1 Tax=Tundrisphaera lichenicola TaxID=2029860 RepID=UPI003EB703BC
MWWKFEESSGSMVSDSESSRSGIMLDSERRETAAVLVSGGIDSAVLCVHLLRTFGRVEPVYVRFGLRWESVELAILRRFLHQVRRPGLGPLKVIDEPVADVYGTHWSLEGPMVPGADSPDEAVHLPGRNLLLIAKPALWCRLRGISTLALGILESNPFEDSRHDYFESLERVLDEKVGSPIKLIRPFAKFSKIDVIRLGNDLPLRETWSCLSPVERSQCGGCNKCAERRRAFRDAGMEDPTIYAQPQTSHHREF